MKQLALTALLILALPALWANETVRHELVVYKTPYCGCCSKWVTHMKEAGFSTIEIEVDDINAYKKQHGIPAGLASCHTALVEKYVIEGHVPAGDVLSLLRDKPDIHGLTVPGMPIGSPGMEQGSRVQAYDVIAIRHDGSTYLYKRYQAAD